MIQTGLGGVVPRVDGTSTPATPGFSEIQDLLRRADLVVCHGGTGSLITALREGCRIIAVSRRFARGEHYDDHQVEITDAFTARGLIETADRFDDFVLALAAVKVITPRCATTDPVALIDYLRQDLSAYAASHEGG